MPSYLDAQATCSMQYLYTTRTAQATPHQGTSLAAAIRLEVMYFNYVPVWGILTGTAEP